MAYYRLSKVVKMRRLALGVKREEFDADGPTGMTVYRMEEGKHKTSERTYRSLTRSMGIEESTYQGILKTKRLDELQMTYEIVCALLNKNHEEAEHIIKQLEDGLDTKDMRNQQYLRHMKEMIRYEKAEIAPEEYEKVLLELLRYRVPKGYKVDMAQWPLHVREFQIMHALNNVLKRKKQYEEQRELMHILKEILVCEYMNSEDRKLYQIITSLCLADALGNMEKHREAIAVDEKNLMLCEGEEEWRYLADVYYDMFWNYWMIKEKETLSELEEEKCRQCLLNAYYVDKVHGELHPRFGQRLRECYPGEL